jgi:copper chaperone CopZ
METIVIKIAGMSCGGCVNSVRNVLTAINGVTKIDVSLPDAQATVEYDLARTTPSNLKAAIRDAGYDTE